MAITFGGFNLDDNTNYIVEDVIGDRGFPIREIIVNDISRREGSKILAEEHKSKTINIRGTIVSDTVDNFNTALDALKVALNKTEQLLVLNTGRSYTATVGRLTVSQDNDEVTIGRFSIDFVVSSGLALGDLQTVELTVASGTNVLDTQLTISGTVFARPVITFTNIDGDGTGYTTTSGITINHVQSGTYITWSGTGDHPTLTYSGNVVFNYDTMKVTESGTIKDFAGFFSEFSVGSNDIETTFLGTTQGGIITISYNPRYL